MEKMFLQQVKGEIRQRNKFWRLCKECLNVLNEIPNAKLNNGTTTYDLAYKIEQTLKEEKSI